VKILTGDPKKAIVKLSIPMIIGQTVFTLYNFADGVWVAGLGAKALAAIGIYFPLFMIFNSLAMGLGVGTTSAISRKIGANDKAGADNVAVHSVILSLVVALVMTSTLPYLKWILSAIGAKGDVLNLAVEYAKIIVAGSVVMVFSSVMSGILRGEGDAKRATYPMIVGALTNIVLDPIFIYKLNLGIAGAAYATVLSMLISSALLLYWVLIKRDTYVNVSVQRFKASGSIMSDILRVGIPFTFSMLTMSVASIFLNLIILNVEGSKGIAAFTSAWRVISFGFIPLLGIGGAATAVIGASFGARDLKKLKTAFFYSIRLAVSIECAIALAMIIFAPYIALAFAYSKSSFTIYGDLVTALRLLPIFLAFSPLGFMTSSMFRGIGRGENALAITIMRALILQLSFAYALGCIFHLGFTGVLLGITIGNITSAFISFTWGALTIKGFAKELPFQ